MKKNILNLVLAGVLTTVGTQVSATQISDNSAIEFNVGTITETFKVYGNCGTCEKTIEGSLKDVKGIKKADWDKDTKMMVVTFNPDKISLDDIKKKIAEVGYDTDAYRASDEAYFGLMGCCQYERPEKK